MGKTELELFVLQRLAEGTDFHVLHAQDDVIRVVTAWRTFKFDKKGNFLEELIIVNN